MNEDALWIQQILAGDEEAFRRLIDKYQTAIHALILSQVRSSEDAQELTQEVFLKAYLKLASLRQPERLYAWLRQIARHQCQDWQRKKQESSLPLQEDIATEIPTADEQLVLQETLAKVMQAVDELPEMEREILKARYLQDSSFTELQEKYELSYKAVTMRLVRGRQKVRKQLKSLLSGIVAFPWHDSIKRVLVDGGLEIMKLSMKTRIAIVGAALLLAVSSGILIWHSHQSAQEAL